MRRTTRRNAEDLYVVLGVTRGATQDEIKRAYRRLAAQFHPDMPTGDEARFKEVAAAYEVLSDHERREQYDRTGDSGPQEQFRMRSRGERPAASTSPWAKKWAERQAGRQQARAAAGPPAWQTDPRGGSHINEAAGFSDKNFCLRSIHEKALQGGGPLLLTTFWSFDGAFGRGALTAYSSEAGLGHGGMVVESWIASEHPTKAVFATFAGVPQKALLVRLLGADVADVTDGLWIDFCGDVPWSDPAFTKSAVTLVSLAEDKLGVVQTERPRRIRGAFYCAECQRQIPLEGGALPARCDFCDADLTRFTGLPSSVVGLEAPFEKAWSKKRNVASTSRRYRNSPL